ncbi:MAG TPA: FtsX-like permease family protein, partial [Longimicrobiales bacterium]|nr:FtsX-like permease family protein [Longimicrobiales bacterium]
GEMGVRLALGAGRLALLRQLLIENLLLFVLGAVVGVPVAVAGVRWLLAATPGGLPRAEEIGVDGPVLAAAFVFATVLGLLFGLLPALQAARTRIAGRLPGRSGGGSAAQALRSGLGIGQLALSVTLLAGAGLLARSLWELQNVDPGFRPEGLTVLRMSLPDDYAGERVPAFYRALPERLGAIPGVEAVTATNALPVSGGEGRGEITVDGRPFDPGSAPSASFRRVLPGYFDVMGIPVLAGRDFDERDGRGEPVVIVNATLAERMFPNGSAIGRRIRVGPSEDEPWLTVVGVVGDVRNETLEEVDAFATYEPHAQRPWSSMYVVARAAGGDPAALVAPIRDAVLAREPGLYVYEGGTMEERMADSTAARRFIATLLGGFALLALLLGTIGVYGLTAWTVARRRREMGIRMALGASHGRIVARMVGGAARLAAVGLALGSVGAVLFGRLLRGLLFEVSPFDPSTGLAIAAALGAATLLAAWLPTRRLEHADTVTVLAEP